MNPEHDIKFDKNAPAKVRVIRTRDQKGNDGYWYEVADKDEFEKHVQTNLNGNDPRNDRCKLPKFFLSDANFDEKYEENTVRTNLYLRDAEIEIENR